VVATVMTHLLRERHPQHALVDPMIATLRYRCTCATKEVLQISVALDAHTTEEQFLWTMRQMWRDVQFKVAQHLKLGAGAVSEGNSAEHAARLG